MRDIVFRYESLTSLGEFLRQYEQALPLDRAVPWTDGEWVLAIFEVGQRGRATAAVGSVSFTGEVPFVSFDRRDWERVHDFASTHADDSMSAILATAPARPTVDSIPPRRAEARTSLLEVSVEGARVLVVDPDTGVAEMLAGALASYGIVVEYVPSAAFALLALASGAFEVVVAEFALEGMSGIELCRRLRDDERLDALPVVLMTDVDDWRVRTEAFGVGADDWLQKPFGGEEVAARCVALVRRCRHAQRQLGAAT